MQTVPDIVSIVNTYLVLGYHLGTAISVSFVLPALRGGKISLPPACDAPFLEYVPPVPHFAVPFTQGMLTEAPCCALFAFAPALLPVLIHNALSVLLKKECVLALCPLMTGLEL